MTENDWRSCADPSPMLEFVARHLGPRKLRLFAVACCRRVLHLTSSPRAPRAVEAAEAQAEGGPTPPRRRRRRAPLPVALYACYCCGRRDARAAAETASFLAARAIGQATYFGMWGAHDEPPALRDLIDQDAREAEEAFEIWRDRQEHEAADAAQRLERKAQADLLREIAGDPFRAPRLDPTWLSANDACVRRLAATIYDDQRFSDLPLLADALLDAGCDEELLIAHCRSSIVHVRGCWALDLLLEKQ